MPGSRFLGIDIGTSAVKCLLVDAQGAVLTRAAQPYAPMAPGSLEQRPQDWWHAVCKAVRGCLDAAGGAQPVAVSFSGHMSAPVLLDARGAVLRPAILIADTRSDAQAKLLARTHGAYLRRLCGNPAINAFTAPKLLWCRAHEPALWREAETVLLPKDYIRYRMTGQLATDRTDAGNTLLFDPQTNEWDLELARQLDIPPSMLPPLRASDCVVGRVSGGAAAETGLQAGIPVITGAADMACSQLGTGATKPGIVALTLSTSIQIVQAADAPSDALYGKMTWHPSAQGGLYAMASVFAGGLSLDWILQLLTGGGPLQAQEYAAWDARLQARRQSAARDAPLFLPFLTGSGSPRFDPTEQALFSGLSMRTTAEDLVLAVLEGVAFHVRENLELLAAHFPQHVVHLAGGGCRMTVWRQIFADVLGRELHLLSNHDGSALGAAMLAARGVGTEIAFAQANPVRHVIRPQTDADGARYRTYQALCLAKMGPAGESIQSNNFFSAKSTAHGEIIDSILG